VPALIDVCSPGRRHPRHEETRLARADRLQDAHPVDHAPQVDIPGPQALEDAGQVPCWQQRRHADGFPEGFQSVEARFWRVAGDQRAVDGADGRAGDPVRPQSGLMESLVDTRLIGAQGATALQDQRHRLIRLACAAHRASLWVFAVYLGWAALPMRGCNMEFLKGIAARGLPAKGPFLTLNSCSGQKGVSRAP
jgi:hypothetical protein